MTWASLLSESTEQTLPWTGGRKVHSLRRSFSIAGDLPQEFGWHRFQVSGGRRVSWVGTGEPDLDFDQGRTCLRGFLVGSRFVPDGARCARDVFEIFDQCKHVWLVEPGLERLARVLVAKNRDGQLIFVREEFPTGPELDVIEAWQDGKDTIAHIPGVSPALELAFQWLAWQRLLLEERRRKQEEERLRIEAELQRQALMETVRKNAERRQQAHRGFRSLAEDALQASGATYLDHRPARNRRETIVTFRYRRRRFECVVETTTLRIIDSGICLQDHDTGERGDDRFTLESLPAVIAEAMRDGKLVVFRHG